MSETIEDQGMVEASGCGCGGTPENAKAPIQTQSETPGKGEQPLTPTSINFNHNQGVSMSANPHPITPSQAAEPAGGIVYAIGVLGYDFGSEARRDSFKQLMPAVEFSGVQVPANPYDARQMVDYLEENISEAKSLIWTLNLELTPVYAIEPVGSFSREVYETLQQFLSGQVQAEDNPEFIQRVSIPGRITGRTVRLFSGQVVPVIEPQSPRGMYGWHVNSLVSAAIEAVGAEQEGAREEQIGRAHV